MGNFVYYLDVFLNYVEEYYDGGNCDLQNGQWDEDFLVQVYDLVIVEVWEVGMELDVGIGEEEYFDE